MTTHATRQKLAGRQVDHLIISDVIHSANIEQSKNKRKPSVFSRALAEAVASP